MEQNDQLLCNQVGSQIHRMRKHRGLTGERLAEAADISPQYLSELENGKKIMAFTILSRIAAALSVSTDYLLHGGDESGEVATRAAQRLAEMTPLDRDLVVQILAKAEEVVRGLGLELS